MGTFLSFTKEFYGFHLYYYYDRNAKWAREFVVISSIFVDLLKKKYSENHQ